MSALAVQTWWMTHRRLKAFIRQPAYLIITLIQPVIWLFLFGNLFRKVVELPGFGTSSYLDYLVPGVVVMNALASNMWAGMGALEEIERGTLNRFLISPVSRSAIMNASVLEQAVSTAVQSVIIVLLGTVFGALSNTIGMLVRQRETIIALNIFLLLPLTFLSSVFMADGLMPHWMRTVAAFNPLNWAVQASRTALSAVPDWAVVTSRGGWLLVLAALAVWLSTRTFRAYQKSV